MQSGLRLGWMLRGSPAAGGLGREDLPYRPEELQSDLEDNRGPLELLSPGRMK